MTAIRTGMRQWGYRELDPGDYTVGEWHEVIMDPLADLLQLCETVERSVLAALAELDGGPGGWRPRVYLSWGRKKAIQRELGRMRDEARLLASTTSMVS